MQAHSAASSAQAPAPGSHFLPVTFKALHDPASVCLQPLLLQSPPSSFHSSKRTSLQTIPQTGVSSHLRAFAQAFPSAWHALPAACWAHPSPLRVSAPGGLLGPMLLNMQPAPPRTCLPTHLLLSAPCALSSFPRCAPPANIPSNVLYLPFIVCLPTKLSTTRGQGSLCCF